MLVSFQDNVFAKRILTLERQLLIIVQALGATPIRLASNRVEAELAAFSGGLDGIQINPSVNNTDIFKTPWIGELWVIAVNANQNTQAVIVIPGLNVPFQGFVD